MDPWPRKPVYYSPSALDTEAKVCYTHEMAQDTLQRRKSLLTALIAMVGITSVAIIIPMLVPASSPTQALIARQKTHDVWKVFEEDDVMSGATIPADTNVVFHVPFIVDRISREVLFGLQGKNVRYWGYCYPENNDPDVVDRRVGLKGLLFLSEREREVRAEEAEAARARYSLENLPTQEELEAIETRPATQIRHQIDFFKGGQLCYLMTETPLAIGIDEDDDRLNTRVEYDLGTNPLKPDTDGDGIFDGIEKQFRTDPLNRDTDNDGILDGIEDANWNGIINKGETDPRTTDFDRDGLCDGVCRTRLSNGQVLFLGEDKNLDGSVSANETDPRLKDTDNDGINDFQEYLVCLTAGRRACK